MFFYLSEGMENCEMSGKNQGILRWMISGNPAGVIIIDTHDKDRSSFNPIALRMAKTP